MSQEKLRAVFAWTLVIIAAILFAIAVEVLAGEPKPRIIDVQNVSKEEEKGRVQYSGQLVIDRKVTRGHCGVKINGCLVTLLPAENSRIVKAQWGPDEISRKLLKQILP